MATFENEDARVSQLPSHSGDGYSFGGGTVITIGQISIVLGDGEYAHLLAEEIARRWNAGRAALSPDTQEAEHGRD